MAIVMIERAVCGALRTSLSSVITPSLQLSKRNYVRVESVSTRFCHRPVAVRVSARQAHGLSSSTLDRRELDDDDDDDDKDKEEENGISQLRELCASKVPDYILRRAEELGFSVPTNVQQQALPILLSGRDCILHAQTGSGKTLAYLLPIFAKVQPTRAAVQAIVIVPTRELGMQVAKVARKLAGKGGSEDDGKAATKKYTVMVMTLLEGGTSSRQKAWLKAEPPQIVVGTLERVARMIETKNLRPNSVTTIVIDENRWML